MGFHEEGDTPVTDTVQRGDQRCGVVVVRDRERDQLVQRADYEDLRVVVVEYLVDLRDVDVVGEVEASRAFQAEPVEGVDAGDPLCGAGDPVCLPLPLAGRVLDVDVADADRADRGDLQRVDADGGEDRELPQPRGFPAALGAGEDDPVAAFEEAGDQPVVFVVDGVEHFAEGEHREAVPAGAVT